MNFKAYNELRLQGHDPETAMELAKTYQPIGIYEEKRVTDNASHGGFTRVIGLKEGFKSCKKNDM